MAYSCYGSLFYVPKASTTTGGPGVLPSYVLSPPQDVTAVAGDTTATVTWTTPVDDNGSPITGYTVTSGPGGFTCTVSEPSANTCVVHGLTNGTKYTFTVVAITVNGVSSPGGPSNIVIPEGPTKPAKPLKVIVILDPFVTGSPVLLAHMKNQLVALARLIKKDIGTSLSITGYTDSRNGVAYNYLLGLHRAQSAFTFLKVELKALGVKVSFPISVMSKGLSAAAASNATAAGQAKNRRVVLIGYLK